MLKMALHKKQARIFACRARVIVVCAGRGFGKSVLLLTKAVIVCLSFKGTINPVSPQVVLLCMPYLKMARQIHWQPLLLLLQSLPIVEQVNKSDFRIVWKGDKPDLIIRGADNGGDKLRGLNLLWVGVDEFQDIGAQVWDTILQPALSRNADWSAVVIGTPKGKSSYFHQFHIRAIATEDWAYFHAKTADNPFIRRREIARAKAQLPPKVFRQEYEAGWEDFDGQLLPSLGEHHQLAAGGLPEAFSAVLVGLDWGDVNPAVCVIGVVDGDYYILESWHNVAQVPVTEVELCERVGAACTRWGAYRCYLPDDRTASILSFRRYGKKHGIAGMRRSIQVKRNKPGPLERATIADALFYQDRLFISSDAAPLHSKMGSYHRATDSAGNLTTAIAPGQDAHEIDAALYVLGQLEGHIVNPGETHEPTPVRSAA